MPKLMIKDTIQPLTIEKMVKLLSDFHLAEFKNHLEVTNAHVPLRLVKAVDRDQSLFQGGDALCQIVYGTSDARVKLNFNQLGSYTFRLSGWLSRNYPSFLSHNLELLEVLVNSGQLDKANILADNVLDIASKVEDFRTEAAVLSFLTQESYLHYRFGESVRLQTRLIDVLEIYKIFNEIQLHFKVNFNITSRRIDVLDNIDEHLSYFGKYTNHSSFAIQAFSRYATLFIKYYFLPDQFFTEATQEYLLDLEEDLSKYSYVTMPFLSDMQTKLTLFKLNFPDYNFAEKEGRKELEKLQGYSEYYKFWSCFADLPQLYVSNVKGTYYLSKYHHILHNPGYDREWELETADRKDIALWTEKARLMLENTNWGKNHINDMVHLRLNYCALLLLGSSDNKRKSVKFIEETLVSYQQLSFSESLDSFIVCLMIGYFSLGDYEKTSATFTRYVKLQNTKIINKDNDWLIYTYYYVSQWIINGRKQYAIKLWELFDLIPGDPIFAPNKRLIVHLASDFEVPKHI